MQNFKKNMVILGAFVRRSIKNQYRNSVLGVIWTVLNPLLNMLVMWFVFSNFFGGGDPTYYLYLFCGVMIFTFVRNATEQATTAIVDSSGLLTKVQIPYWLLPTSRVTSSVVSYGFSYVSMIGVMAVNYFIGNGAVGFGWGLLESFILVPAIYLFSMGMAYVLCSMYVFFRDILHFYQVFLTLWMYMTPLFWKTTMIGGGFLVTVIKLNPLFYFITAFRQIIYGYDGDITIIPQFVHDIGIIPFVYIMAVVVFGIGLVFFKSTKKKFIYHI